MKNKFMTLLMILCSSLFLVNCAKNNSSNNNAAAAVAVTGQCTTAGYVYTQWMCTNFDSLPDGLWLY
jgi:uncharacterized lipoprotein YajG